MHDVDRMNSVFASVFWLSVMIPDLTAHPWDLGWLDHDQDSYLG